VQKGDYIMDGTLRRMTILAIMGSKRSRLHDRRKRAGRLPPARCERFNDKHIEVIVRADVGKSGEIQRIG